MTKPIIWEEPKKDPDQVALEKFMSMSDHEFLGLSIEIMVNSGNDDCRNKGLDLWSRHPHDFKVIGEE